MRAGQGIIVISITLLMLGVLMVNSAGMRVSIEDPPMFKDMLLSRPTLLAFFAMIAMFIGSRFPIHLFEQSLFRIPLILWLLPLSLVLLIAVYVPGIGREVNSANRWVNIGGLTFQPSEIAKWTMVLVVAWWGATHLEQMKLYVRGFLPPIALVGVMTAIIAVEDLGTAVLIFTTACIVFFAAGCRTLHFASFLPVAVGGFILAIYTSPYRIARLQTYLHPFDDPDRSGYHILQSMSTISSGGLSGLGLGNGTHKFGYLPEDTTDFIFSVICEELGIFGAVAVASLFVGLVTMGVVVIHKTKDRFKRLLVLGIITTIGLQAAMNMLVVTALVPTKGIALPLLSNGGTGWLLTALCIGLIDAIDRTNKPAKSMQEHRYSTATTTHA
jgi:cell division protein FtsW